MKKNTQNLVSKMLLPNKTNLIKGRLYWSVAYLLIALSFVFIANDNTLIELLKIPSFYTDIIFALILTYGIGYYLSKLNDRLDLKYSWNDLFKIRLFKQFIFGVILPLSIAMMLEILYLKAININISKSSILNLELPLAFIFLVLINLVSLTSYLLNNKQTVIVKELVIKQAPVGLEYINIQKGFVEERLELARCALIMGHNKLLWLHTFEGEKHRISGTLDEWEAKLRDSNFYRINRQCISSFKAIKSVEQTETRKLKVNFVFPTEEVYISKPNVAKFKLWWKQ